MESRTFKVKARPRMKDISTANAKPAKGQDMVSWAEGFTRAGIRFSTDKYTWVTIVDGKPYPGEGEVSPAGAMSIILEPRLEVADCKIVRDILAEAVADYRKKPGMYGQLPRPFVHAEIKDESGESVQDDSVPGQEVIFEDGYDDMTKAQLMDAMLNKGFAETDAKRISIQGKAAMIAELRGEN
jgi:hypothetical protein